MNDVEALLQKYRGEVTTAIWSYFAWKSINNVAAKDPAIHAALNSNALTWNIVTHALQTTFVITLGRIFDVDRGALSVHSFLNKCQTEVEQFSKSALAMRKRRGAKDGAPWLTDYLADAYEPTKEDFRLLKRAVKPHQSKYEEIYRPIRNLVMAHKNLEAAVNSDVLFAKTRIGDIQDILTFLYQVEAVVTQLLFNGRKTELQDHVLREEEFVLKDIEILLGKLRS